jgi:hypothetical protein
MPANPYKPFHVNLDMFYGKDRMKLAKDIARDLAEYSESTAVVGGQRMGKTTLLYKIKKELSARKDVLSYYVNGQARTELDGSDASFAWLGTYAGVNNAGYADFGRAIKAKWIRDGAYSKIVFLIDEFDAFGTYSWHRHFFDNLRSLLSNNLELRDNIAVVVAGPKRLERLLLGGEGSPLGNVLSWRYLGLLDEEDTKRLVNDPTNGEVSQDDQRVVFRKTGGQPFFVQALMSKVFDVTPEQFQRELNAAEKDFLNRHDGTFRLWWENHLSQEEREVFSMIDSKGSISKDELKKVLPSVMVTNAVRILSYMGFIRPMDENSFCVAGSILKEWVAQNP